MDIQVKKMNILLMDDDVMLRNMTARILKIFGHHVVIVADGKMAIDYYNKNFFDVVILDLTIPDGMGGIETLLRLKEINSDVKAIAYSGFNPESTKIKHFNYFLHKPFKINEIAAALEAVM